MQIVARGPGGGDHGTDRLRARVQALPKGDPNETDVLRKFATAVLPAPKRHGLLLDAAGHWPTGKPNGSPRYT